MIDQPITVGIDVGSERLDVYIRSTGETMAVPNTTQGFRVLVKVLKVHEPSLVVMESTAGYERPVAYALDEADIPVAIVNGDRVRSFRNAKGIKAKTDRIDAKMLAEYGAVMLPRVTILPNAAERDLRNLVSRRQQLVKMQIGEQHHLRRASAKLRPYVEETIASLSSQQLQIEIEIAEAVDKNPVWKQKSALLCSVPGVGVVTAATIIARMPEIGLVNRREIAALVGVAPYNQDSGRVEGKRTIGGGRKDLRNALYMATLSAVRCNPVIKMFYDRLIAAGKAPKLAITACMRKLIVIINSMVRNGEPWRSATSDVGI